MYMKLAVTAKGSSTPSIAFFCLLTQLDRLLYYFTRTMEEKYSSGMFSRGLHDIRLRDSCDRRHSNEATDLLLFVRFSIHLP